MANDIQLYEAPQALVQPKRMNYEISIPNGATMTLKREVDFGVIPKTKRPTLFKSGAETVCKAYGVFPRYTRVSAIEAIDPEPFFYYSYECKLVKIATNGIEYVLANGFGNSNSKEANNGFNSAFNSANKCEKQAQKRALVAAAINLGGLSGMFYADMDDETFVTKGFEDMKLTADDNAPVTPKQIKRLYAIGADSGKNVEEIKQILAAKGYTSTKDIKQAQYDEVCRLVGGENVEGKEAGTDTKKD